MIIYSFSFISVILSKSVDRPVRHQQPCRSDRTAHKYMYIATTATSTDFDTDH
jgi:hypothetical protein